MEIYAGFSTGLKIEEIACSSAGRREAEAPK
jgi:hypothetical protein